MSQEGCAYVGLPIHKFVSEICDILSVGDFTKKFGRIATQFLSTLIKTFHNLWHKTIGIRQKA